MSDSVDTASASLVCPPGYGNLPARVWGLISDAEQAIAAVVPDGIPVDVYLLFAIMDRESMLRHKNPDGSPNVAAGSPGDALFPKGPTGTGDFDALSVDVAGRPLPGAIGHGRGLMQIDDRSHMDWLALTDPTSGQPLWQIPVENMKKACQILVEDYTILDDVPGMIAAYNCGVGRVKPVLSLTAGLSTDARVTALDQEIKALDQKTTGHDYVSWVIERRSRFLPGPDGGSTT